MDMHWRSKIGTKWFIDTGNSFVGFAVRHYGISFVRGIFTRFVANVEFDPEDIPAAKIQVTIDATSLNTNNARRDTDLQEAEYLNTEKYPEIIFVSRSIDKINDKRFLLTGDLTIKGITKEVVLNVTYGGKSNDPMGIQHSGFAAETMIYRKDFNITAHTPLPTGDVMVGEDVRITLDVELRE